MLAEEREHQVRLTTATDARDYLDGPITHADDVAVEALVAPDSYGRSPLQTVASPWHPGKATKAPAFPNKAVMETVLIQSGSAYTYQETREARFRHSRSAA